MRNPRHQFYKNIVEKRISNKDATILICGGGLLDKDTFLNLGYTNVTLTNLDTRTSADKFSPYKWDYQDAQSLSYDDDTFDYVVIHAAIHHAPMPHKVLLEMYRVSKIGILAFEARDSLLMRIVTKLNLSQEYEHAAVFYNDCSHGGVNNTQIPNYVFRWTEREIEKTIQSYNPISRHTFLYDYGSAYPCTPELELKNGLKVIILSLLKPLYIILSKIFYKQQNQFAFYISKITSESNLFPWLCKDKNTNNVKFNKAWAEKKYKK